MTFFADSLGWLLDGITGKASSSSYWPLAASGHLAIRGMPNTRRPVNPAQLDVTSTLIYAAEAKTVSAEQDVDRVVAFVATGGRLLVFYCGWQV